MAKFNEYPTEATPTDDDTLLMFENTSKKNRQTPFSGVWNWIVKKLTDAVISNLQTENKTVIGALNELNSKANFKFIGNYDITPDNNVDNKIHIKYPTDAQQIFVSYGRKNSAQAYGGGTILFLKDDNKPCYLPVYGDIKTSSPIDIVYIYNYTTEKEIVAYSENIQNSLLLKVWYKK